MLRCHKREHFIFLIKLQGVDCNVNSMYGNNAFHLNNPAIRPSCLGDYKSCVSTWHIAMFDCIIVYCKVFVSLCLSLYKYHIVTFLWPLCYKKEKLNKKFIILCCKFVDFVAVDPLFHLLNEGEGRNKGLKLRVREEITIFFLTESQKYCLF